MCIQSRLHSWTNCLSDSSTSPTSFTMGLELSFRRQGFFNYIVSQWVSLGLKKKAPFCKWSFKLQTWIQPAKRAHAIINQQRHTERAAALWNSSLVCKEAQLYFPSCRQHLTIFMVILRVRKQQREKRWGRIQAPGIPCPNFCKLLEDISGPWSPSQWASPLLSTLDGSALS